MATRLKSSSRVAADEKAARGAIHAQVDPELKAEAESILAELGLDSGEAIRLLYRQVVLTRGLPFALKLPPGDFVPNASTQEAIREAISGENLIRVAGVEELFERAGI